MSIQSTFWQWFSENEEELFNTGLDEEETFEKIANALESVDPNLTFELGPKGSTRDFIVSAGGIKDAFPAVESLVNSAPELVRWKIIAFRPRRVLPCVVELGGKKVNSEDVEFSLLDNGEISGVRLFIPSFAEDDVEWKQIGYLLLDEALGEYDVESNLGLVKMYSPKAQTQERRYPLSQLSKAFDSLVARLMDKNTTLS